MIRSTGFFILQLPRTYSFEPRVYMRGQKNGPEKTYVQQTDSNCDNRVLLTFTIPPHNTAARLVKTMFNNSQPFFLSSPPFISLLPQQQDKHIPNTILLSAEADLCTHLIFQRSKRSFTPDNREGRTNQPQNSPTQAPLHCSSNNNKSTAIATQL